ncbi:MAG: NAD-dependent DNA ligase LigA [Myxococcaceae bacterium]
MQTSPRVTELEGLLRQYKDAYYHGQPLVSDAAYDALEDELRELAPDHPILASVGAPAVKEWEKARHAIPMGSLNKAVDEEELRKWAERCDELAAKDQLLPISNELFVTEKLDGLSLAVTYENGVLKDAITRGDGVFGERITANARRMKGMLSKLPEPVSITVRGEIVFKLSDFRVAFPGATNPRNQAAGTSKRLDGQGSEALSLFVYDLDGEELPTEVLKLERLKALGFLVPFFEATNLEGVIALHQRYNNELRAKLDYEIDGLVVRANSVRAQDMLGEKGNRPRAAVAFKFPSQVKLTKVVNIRWETGPSGRVSPVAIVEPVLLAGANVQRASLHNVSNVASLGIGVGDDVLVSRRNDVIPYVEEVVVKHGPVEQPPTQCTTCQAALERNGEYLVCRNKSCRAIVEGRLLNWIGAQGILEWGEKLIAQLVDAGLVKEPADLYRLTVQDIAGLERRGEVIAQKVLDNLKAQLPLSLVTFLTALGIEMFGLQTAKAIVAGGFDTLEKVQKATFGELAVLQGVGPAKAKAVVDGLKDREEEIGRLLAAGVQPVYRSAAGLLAGKTVCFTGSLSRPRKELEQMVEQRGGTLLSGVTKELSYLVMADPESGSSKAQKAKKYGTLCIDEEGFLTLANA